MHSEIPEVIYMNEGKEVVIPCRVTSPTISVTLKKVKLSNAPGILLLPLSTMNSEIFHICETVFLQTCGLLTFYSILLL